MNLWSWVGASRWGMTIAAIVLVWLLSRDWTPVLYVTSFAYHAVNLHAFLFRRGDHRHYLFHSLALRAIAIGVLVLLLVPYLRTDIHFTGVPFLVVGTTLHAAAVAALGLRRTYYGAEFGALRDSRVQTFPYGWIPHPMAVGSCLEFLGLYFLVPSFSGDYPFLLTGHMGLTVLTAVIEHFDLHFRDHFFPASLGSIGDVGVRASVDRVRDWSLATFRPDPNAECSMHRYVKTLPSEIVSQIDQLRYCDEVMDRIRATFPESRVIPLAATDELYISRYNFDRGGDQGLFDRHHDGNLRFLPAATVVRSLLYLSSDDRLEVVFDTSGEKRNFKTYDFGLLDFHKELHWVDGAYEPGHPPRVLLKCNYYVDHSGIAPYRWFAIALNVSVFYAVKAAMEYSKSPKTLPQRTIGLLCNLFRRLNNLSPAAPVVLILLVAAVSLRALFLQLRVAF